MNREDARKLMGGYATGSLTEAERRMLFEAALEDQELFDELVGEQALKEVLDAPGARARLLTAVAPAPEQRRWSWWAWGTVAGAVAAGLVLFIVTRTPAPENAVQIAAVKPDAAIPPPQPQAPKEPPAGSYDAFGRRAAPVEQEQKRAAGPAAPVQSELPEERQRFADQVAPVAPPKPVQAPPPAALRRVEALAQQAQQGQQVQQAQQGPQGQLGQQGAAALSPAAQSTLSQDGQRGADQRGADQLAAAAAPQAETALLKTETGDVSQTVTAGQFQQLPVTPATKGGGGKGGAAAKGGAGALVVKGQPANAATAVFRANEAAAVPFSFTYQRTADSLRITPLAQGFLVVTAAGQALFPQNAVLAGSNVIVPLPAGTGDVTVVFAASAGAPAAQAVRRDGATGTVTDPNSSPSSRLAIIVPAVP